MTTLFRETVTCAGCQKSSEHDGVSSTNAFGSPDLDLRPPEMQRSTIRFWLRQCPHCGYVAPDLSRAAGDMSVVKSAAYRAILQDTHFPELARRFLAHATLVAASPNSAAQARLHAAWVCDDMRQSTQAAECRKLAAESFGAMKPFEDSEQGVTTGAILVDVLRRAGEFDQAAAECDALLQCKRAAGPLRQVLEFQRRLAVKQDASAHRVDECVR